MAATPGGRRPASVLGACGAPRRDGRFIALEGDESPSAQKPRRIRVQNLAPKKGRLGAVFALGAENSEALGSRSRGPKSASRIRADEKGRPLRPAFFGAWSPAHGLRPSAQGEAPPLILGRLRLISASPELEPSSCAAQGLAATAFDAFSGSSCLRRRSERRGNSTCRRPGRPPERPNFRCGARP